MADSTTATDLQDESLVGIGAPKLTGAVFVAPKGTTLPTNASDALDGAFKCMGFISEDGVTISEDADSQEINAWGGRLARTLRTTYHETVTLTPIEQNEVVLRETYGTDNVSVTTADGKKNIAVRHTADTSEPRVGVIETVPTPSAITRYVFPKLVLDERGDKSLTGTDSEGRELTYRAEQDEYGVTCYEYTCLTLPAEPDGGTDDGTDGE